MKTALAAIAASFLSIGAAQALTVEVSGTINPFELWEDPNFDYETSPFWGTFGKIRMEIANDAVGTPLLIGPTPSYVISATNLLFDADVYLSIPAFGYEDVLLNDGEVSAQYRVFNETDEIVYSDLAFVYASDENFRVSVSAFPPRHTGPAERATSQDVAGLAQLLENPDAVDFGPTAEAAGVARETCLLSIGCNVELAFPFTTIVSDLPHQTGTEITPVPVPGAGMLLLGALGALGLRRKAE